MALEIHKIARLLAVPGMEEMVVAHLRQGRERCIGRNVAADTAIVFVGAYHHRHGVPPDQALNAPLDHPIAGIRDFLFHRNGIDIGSAQRGGRLDAIESGPVGETCQQVRGSFRPALLHDSVQSFQPFAGLLYVGILAGYEFSCKHGSNLGVTFTIALVELRSVAYGARWKTGLGGNTPPERATDAK